MPLSLVLSSPMFQKARTVPKAEFLIYAADDLASLLRYPLCSFVYKGESKEATDQADSHGTSTTDTDYTLLAIERNEKELSTTA